MTSNESPISGETLEQKIARVMAEVHASISDSPSVKDPDETQNSMIEKNLLVEALSIETESPNNSATNSPQRSNLFTDLSDSKEMNIEDNGDTSPGGLVFHLDLDDIDYLTDAKKLRNVEIVAIPEHESLNKSIIRQNAADSKNLDYLVSQKSKSLDLLHRTPLSIVSPGNISSLTARTSATDKSPLLSPSRTRKVSDSSRATRGRLNTSVDEYDKLISKDNPLQTDINAGLALNSNNEYGMLTNLSYYSDIYNCDINNKSI